jgi:hypothetical protein
MTDWWAQDRSIPVTENRFTLAEHTMKGNSVLNMHNGNVVNRPPDVIPAG